MMMHNFIDKYLMCPYTLPLLFVYFVLKLNLSSNHSHFWGWDKNRDKILKPNQYEKLLTNSFSYSLL